VGQKENIMKLKCHGQENKHQQYWKRCKHCIRIKLNRKILCKKFERKLL